MSYRYQLGGSKLKRTCPWCEAKKRFSPYIDATTGEVLEGFGRCDRINSCPVHHKRPEGGVKSVFRRPPPPPPRRQSHFLHPSVLEQLDQPNIFHRWIRDRFGEEALHQVLLRFPIYSYPELGHDWVVWMHADADGKLHTGKMMRYEIQDGEPRRVRSGYANDWLHKKISDEVGMTYTQTLFGGHSLACFPSCTVGVVESEKTAVIASIYFPEMAWVSVGSESLLTAYDGSCSIMKPLRGREVVLFPDLGAEDSWTTKILTLRKHGFDCSISSLKGIASEEDVANGYDLADYLLIWSVEEFQT